MEKKKKSYIGVIPNTSREDHLDRVLSNKNLTSQLLIISEGGNIGRQKVLDGGTGFLPGSLSKGHEGIEGGLKRCVRRRRGGEERKDETSRKTLEPERRGPLNKPALVTAARSLFSQSLMEKKKKKKKKNTPKALTTQRKEKTKEKTNKIWSPMATPMVGEPPFFTNTP